jgi:glycosyltransferase involved in cell wall biosynthesis
MRDLLPERAVLREMPFRHISPKTVFLMGSFVDEMQADLFHSPFMLQPLFMKTPGIITIHDAMWWKHPWFQAKEEPLRMAVGWLYYRTLVRLCVSQTRRMITVSEATKTDVAESWPHAIPKLRVVAGGVEDCFKPASDPARTARLLEDLGVENKAYFLHVTNGRPYKNTLALLRAFARIAPHSDQRMLIVGNLGRFRTRVVDTIKELRIEDRTKVLGSVTDEQVIGLMQSALALAFPSLFEGFGLPVLESMACGCPVLTSNRGSLAEVAGDDALIVDPTSIDSMAEGLLKLTRDPQLRESLKLRGLSRASHFTWSEAARSIIKIYQEVLEEST